MMNIKIALAAFLVAVCIQPSHAAGCLEENTKVVLTGRRMTKEKDVRGIGESKSRIVSIPILALALPICVRESPSGPEHKEVRELQLAADSKKVFEDMKTLINATVDIEGTIFFAETQYHYLDVIITVRTIKRHGSETPAKR
jgi:hypothetical protein